MPDFLTVPRSNISLSSFSWQDRNQTLHAYFDFSNKNEIKYSLP